jgi:O-methyltransferase
MNPWRESVNSVLVRATGYRLERPRSAPARAASMIDRLEAVTSRLEALPGLPAKPKTSPKKAFPDDFDDEIGDLIRAVRPFTMTSPDKLHALITATRYLHRYDIPGSIVECGVWRGGSMHAVARTLDSLGDHSRELYLFDTFEGMPPPTEKDVRRDGRRAEELLAAGTKDQFIWAYATLEDVRKGFDTVPYPGERVHYVCGKVEDTVPGQAPDPIALLRLDTDWYESTRHELVHLYPRLVSGGVLIIDDYGTWQGSQRATDEFLADSGARLLLQRAGRGRIAVKP